MTKTTLKSELSQLFFYDHRNGLNPFLQDHRRGAQLPASRFMEMGDCGQRNTLRHGLCRRYGSPVQQTISLQLQFYNSTISPSSGI